MKRDALMECNRIEHAEKMRYRDVAKRMWNILNKISDPSFSHEEFKQLEIEALNLIEEWRKEFE